MIIDWFTTIAQIVNFLILVALLKHFLFNPIVLAMHERKARADKAMEDAEDKQKEAEKTIESYRNKEREIDEKRDQLILQAEQDAQKKGDEHLQKLHKEADENHARLEDALKKKKLDIAERLRLMSLHDAAGITEQALQELSSVPIEEGLVNVFISRLNATKQKEREQLIKAAGKGGNILKVKSSSDLNDDLQKKLLNAVRSELSDKISLKFQSAPDLVLGIEMDVDGYKLQWGVDQFLEDIKDQVSKVITDSFGYKKAEKNA